mmetsp:Transcript_11633/g.24554  ORF Transcript_11633/g.24554 Transcript_11633/m.24554 type:complete len:962 (-) Transcript_11633:116-3001(-)
MASQPPVAFAATAAGGTRTALGATPLPDAIWRYGQVAPPPPPQQRKEAVRAAALGVSAGVFLIVATARRRRGRGGAAARCAWEVVVDLPVPSPGEVQAAAGGLASAAQKAADGISVERLEAAATAGASFAGELPFRAEATTAFTSAKAAAAAALSGAPPELRTALDAVLTAVTAAVKELPSKLPEELAIPLQSPEVLAPLATPVGTGVALLALLALRRGPQPWLDELPKTYEPEWIESYWSRRPLRLLSKFAQVTSQGGAFWLFLQLDKLFGKEDENMPERAIQARELVTDLGVAFIKIAQVWASRPDILPKPYNREFEKLLEQVRPFGRDQAYETLRRNVEDLRSFVDDEAAFDAPIASASVGQVYQARRGGRVVAVKVQRPDVREQVSIDLYVIRVLCKLGLLIPNESIVRQCRSSLELIALAAPVWFQELDYQAEARSQRRFAETVAGCDLISDNVKVPEVIMATPEVLVQEWLDGEKLTQPGAAQENREKVVTLLLNSYMVQFLETGYLHGDPHPGNFVLMPDGKLGILDYGLMTEIPAEKRVSFIEFLMHLQAKEYDLCLDDLINLEFIPKAVKEDPAAVKILVPAISSTLSALYSEGGDMQKKSKLMMKQREEMKNAGKLDTLRKELQAIAKKYGTFQLPGYFTLILRAFSTLEGLGLRVDSDFSIVQECFPYIARRLITDDSFRIREALRNYLYMGRSRIAIKRVDELTTGFGTFTNLMKANRSEYMSSASDAGAMPSAPAMLKAGVADGGAAVAHAQGAAPAGRGGQQAPVAMDSAARDIADVIFSPEGNFLQELLIDEGIAAVDALSRAALVRLLRTLGPLALPITLPLGLILGASLGGSESESRILAREDKEALLLLRRIVRLIQAPASRRESDARGDIDIRQAAEELRRLQPLAEGLLPVVAPGASAFARRFAQQLARRILLRFAEEIERSAGLEGFGGTAALSMATASP